MENNNMDINHKIMDLCIHNFTENRDGFTDSDTISEISQYLKSLISLTINNKNHNQTIKQLKRDIRVLTRTDQAGTLYLRVIHNAGKETYSLINHDSLSENISNKIINIFYKAFNCANNIKTSGSNEAKIMYSERPQLDVFIESKQGSREIEVGSKRSEEIIRSALGILSAMPSNSTLLTSNNQNESPIAASPGHKINIFKKESHRRISKNINFTGKINGLENETNLVTLNINHSDGSHEKINAKIKTTADYNLAKFSFCSNKEVAIEIIMTSSGSYMVESIQSLATEIEL